MTEIVLAINEQDCTSDGAASTAEEFEAIAVTLLRAAEALRNREEGKLERVELEVVLLLEPRALEYLHREPGAQALRHSSLSARARVSLFWLRCSTDTSGYSLVSKIVAVGR
jgi:hypothetical protein